MSWLTEHKKPYICLAPMAGYTDSAFRQICKRINPDLILFSEMVSADALHHGSKKTAQLIEFNPETENPFIVQLFGKHPEKFQTAVRFIAEQFPQVAGIDINMGCPAKKVVGSEHGSALIKNPALACEIIAACKEAAKIPVSVKTRLGFDSYDPDKFQSFCLGLEKAGCDLLTIHGRTYKQGFGGQADWQPIYEVKKLLKIPVIGNGDIESMADALGRLYASQNSSPSQGACQPKLCPPSLKLRRAAFHFRLAARPRCLLVAKRRLEARWGYEEKAPALDGVMIGRAAFGNPWVFSTPIQNSSPSQGEARWGSEKLPNQTFADKIPLILAHTHLICETKGEKIGMREIRKHLLAYVKGMPGAREARSRLCRVERVEEAEGILNTIGALESNN